MTRPPSRPDRITSDTANRTPDSVAEPLFASAFMVVFIALFAIWSAGGLWTALLAALAADRVLARFARR